MTFDRRQLPLVVLTVAMAVSTAALWMPTAWSGAAQAAVAAWLRPGQIAAIAVRRQVAEASHRLGQHFQTTRRWAEMETELATLRAENERLGSELAAAASTLRAAPKVAPEEAGEPLLRADRVAARVLGQQAIAYLSRRTLLDVGQRKGVEPDSLVVVPRRSAVIDCGQDHRLTPGQLVLSQAQVWGQIVEVGPYTSAVRTVTEPGYRDLVRLVGASGVADAHDRGGPQGVLEGTGLREARIRLVPATEPVSVGDLVYTASDQGIEAEPLLYGSVTRVRRTVGAADWEIWMEPAVGVTMPQRVAVLRTQLNPQRVADGAIK